MQDRGWAWEQVFDLAAREAVLPALSSCNRNLGPSQAWPEPILEFLSGVESLNGERNAAILEEVRFAVQLLNKAGIEPVLLKGIAYLVTSVYASAERYLADVDFLIPEVQMEQAERTLLQNGFEADESDPFAHFRHHRPPLKRPGAIAFELHHALTTEVGRGLLPVAEVLASSRAVDLDGASAKVPGPEHMMMHLIIHSQMQHAYNERIWPPLRAMYDLSLLQRRFAREIDWQAIETKFRAAGAYGTLVLHLLQIQEALGVEPPLAIRLTPMLRLAWLRRRALRRFPPLRYFDPVYMFSILVGRRLSMLRKVLKTPHGTRHLREMFLSAPIYARFLEDLVKGRGK